MTSTRTHQAATCTLWSAAAAAPAGTGMSAFGGAVIVRKPATVDARYDAQGARRAWSPPV